MKIIQITDIHLTAPGQTIAGRDPNANFDRALTHALANHPDAEAIVITGDLSDWGDREDYVRLRARIDALPIPTLLCIGNHDDRDAFLDVFPEMRGEGGFVQSVTPLSKASVVTLDSWAPGTHAGELCAKRLAWLDARLAELAQPALLFLHHNPVPTHIAPVDSIMLEDWRALAAVLSQRRESVLHLFFGHCHLPLAGSLAGVPVSAPRGANHASWPNYGETALLSTADLPESYAVVIVDPPAVTVTMIEFGYDGPITVEGSPDYADWDRSVMVR